MATSGNVQEYVSTFYIHEPACKGILLQISDILYVYIAALIKMTNRKYRPNLLGFILIFINLWDSCLLRGYMACLS
jgi:hypothetical protein